MDVINKFYTLSQVDGFYGMKKRIWSHWRALVVNARGVYRWVLFLNRVVRLDFISWHLSQDLKWGSCHNALRGATPWKREHSVPKLWGINMPGRLGEYHGGHPGWLTQWGGRGSRRTWGQITKLGESWETTTCILSFTLNVGSQRQEFSKGVTWSVSCLTSITLSVVLRKRERAESGSLSGGNYSLHEVHVPGCWWPVFSEVVHLEDCDSISW